MMFTEIRLLRVITNTEERKAIVSSIVRAMKVQAAQYNRSHLEDILGETNVWLK